MGLSANYRNRMLGNYQNYIKQKQEQAKKQAEKAKNANSASKKNVQQASTTASSKYVQKASTTAKENTQKASTTAKENVQQASTTVSSKDIPNETILAYSGIKIATKAISGNLVKKVETPKVNTDKTENAQTKDTPVIKENQEQEGLSPKVTEAQANLKTTIENSQKELNEVKGKIKELEDKYGCQIEIRSWPWLVKYPSQSAIDENGNVLKLGSTGTPLSMHTVNRATIADRLTTKDDLKIKIINNRIDEITTMEQKVDFSNGITHSYFVRVAKPGFEEEYEGLKSEKEKINTTEFQQQNEKLNEYENLINQANTLQKNIEKATSQSNKIETLKQKNNLSSDEQEKYLEKILNNYAVFYDTEPTFTTFSNTN